MELPGRYRLVGTRNLTLLTDELTASQVRNVVKSVSGGDCSGAPTVTVSGGLKFLLAYVWLAVVAGGAIDALARAAVLPPLLQPAAASRASALRAAMTATRWPVTGIFVGSGSAVVRLVSAFLVMTAFLPARYWSWRRWQAIASVERAAVCVPGGPTSNGGCL